MDAKIGKAVGCEYMKSNCKVQSEKLISKCHEKATVFI